MIRQWSKKPLHEIRVEGTCLFSVVLLLEDLGVGSLAKDREEKVMPGMEYQW